MARSLGLPTRIAVGYASTSTAASKGDWVTIGGSQLHAWPEVWIDGVGWLAFEPTPGGIGGQVGAVQAPTTPAAPPTATPSAPAEPTAPAGDQETGAQLSSTAPTAPPSAPASPADRTGGGAAPDLRIPALVLLVLLLAALPGLTRALQRSRRRAAVRRGPWSGEMAWRELVATAVDLDLLRRGTRLRARTPEALAEHLADELGAAAGAVGPGTGSDDPDGGPETGAAGGGPGTGPGGPDGGGPGTGAAALAALTRLAGDVVAERYGTAPADSGRRRRIEGDLDLVTAVMSATASPGRRLLARIVPKSMVGGRFTEA